MSLEKGVRRFCRRFKMDPGNFEDVKQLVRASGSVGANYIEANENVGKGDLIYRIRVCRKESKECMHFLGLVEIFGEKELEEERLILIDEASQLKRIFSTVLTKIIENNRE
jgi:four helix bundle protein